MLQRFFAGFGFIITGQRSLRQVPRLGWWVLLPFLIDVALLGVGGYYGSALVQDMVFKAASHLFAGEGIAYTAFYYAVLVLFWIVFIVVYFYFVYLIASVVASPFYGAMAEKVLVHMKALPERPFALGLFVRQSFRMFGVSLVRALVLLVLGVFLFVASFLPGLNVLAGFVVFVVLAFDAMDYGFEACGFTLRERLKFLSTHVPEFCGMGAFLGLTAFVPGLILLVMPFAVIGATHILGDAILKAKASPN